MTPQKAIHEAAYIKSLGDDLLSKCTGDARVYRAVDNVLGGWAGSIAATDALESLGVDTNKEIE